MEWVISGFKWHVDRVYYLSTLIAVRLRIDDVQHMTSNATHVSHSASPNRQMEPFTWTDTWTQGRMSNWVVLDSRFEH